MEIDASPERLVRSLVKGGGQNVCVLDSCGVGRPGSNMLIAGSDPVQVVRLTGGPESTVREFDRLLSHEDLSAIFTLSYDFGLALNGLEKPGRPAAPEPYLFAALFDSLALHDYDSGRSWIAGGEESAGALASALERNEPRPDPSIINSIPPSSNFSRDEYLNAVEQIKELIREGETYQANLTQQLSVPAAGPDRAADVFLDLRREHPAAFTAYLDRGDSTVVSASPEQFFRIDRSDGRRKITASPIKGTRRRGIDAAEDESLRRDLLSSEKDRAENTMIVDLMRNDLGRICEFGSVAVDELCRLEEHPTLFHLVSTVTGILRPETSYSDILRAVFPCGSITGAPKLRTMEIIDRLENAPRGLSMGAIGCRIPGGVFGIDEVFEMSVAIRTMVIRDDIAVFNVGGGIVSDSDPSKEYEESLLKAKALLRALGVEPRNENCPH